MWDLKPAPCGDVSQSSPIYGVTSTLYNVLRSL